MPSTMPGAVAERPAEPELFARLVDDAAVFPPGSSPLDQAVSGHRTHRSSWYAGLLGPLLVPASIAGEVPALAEASGYSPEAPLEVALVARPGVDPGVVGEALESVAHARTLNIVAVEMGWTPEWRVSRPPDVPLTLEVPRGPHHALSLADIAADSSDEVPLQAKFRTGATPTWHWPDERELAGFIRSAVDHELAFKLTGGLHHAVRGTYPGDPADLSSAPEEQHGVLNVLCAVRWALNGDEVGELASVLSERDPAVLVPMVTRMSSADASIVRAFFTAYGCCTVTDPIGELAALNLIQEP